MIEKDDSLLMGSLIYIPVEQAHWIKSESAVPSFTLHPIIMRRVKLFWLCMSERKFQRKRVLYPLTQRASFDKEKGNKASYLKAVTLLLCAPHSSKATFVSVPRLQMLTMLNPPKLFVLVTPLTWGSHHGCPHRHNHSWHAGNRINQQAVQEA